ncbi:MAG: hypothetical protein HYT03_03035 [Candidatus Harrisonbacteria bacterium]|nr:hypothetical protein [Candidatus Harrisonbacteria bacterium]
MKSVVFCSSQRFKKELAEFIEKLKTEAASKSLHLVIFDPEFENHEKELHLSPEKERMLNPHYRNSVAGKVYDHLFRKVRIADVCYIFNKDGYLGANTNGELFAAAVLGKTIYAHSERTLMGNYPGDLYEEPSSRKLIHEIVNAPHELLKRLI